MKDSNITIYITTLICFSLLFSSCEGWWLNEENPDGADYSYCHANIKIKNNSNIPICCYIINYNYNNSVSLSLAYAYDQNYSLKQYPIMPGDQFKVPMVDYGCLESILSGKRQDQSIPEFVICDTLNFSTKPYGIINQRNYSSPVYLSNDFHVLKRVNINDSSLARLKETDFTIYYP